MDRNSVLGLLLIGAIVITFSIMNKPSEAEKAKLQRHQDSIAQISEQIEEAASSKQVIKEETRIEYNTDSASLIRQAGFFESNIFGEEQFYVLENELLKLTLSNKGGKPYSVQLKEYKTHDGRPLMLFKGDSTVFNLMIPQQSRVAFTQDLFFKPVNTSKKQFANDKEVSFAMRLEMEQGKYIEYLYTVFPGTYMVDFKVNVYGMDEVISRNLGKLDFEWEIYSPQQEKGRKNENDYSSVYYKNFEDVVDDLGLRSRKDEESLVITNDIKWVAFKDQFFSSVLIANDRFYDGEVGYESLPEGDPFLRKFKAAISIPYQGGNSSMDMDFYFGPNHYKNLSKYEDLELNQLVSLGNNIIRVINKYVIIELFNFLQKFIGNYGLIILILTLVIKMVLLPLTYKSYTSQAKMRVLKPQIDAINEKIPKDKAMERQKATMDLYKKVGINPMGGCLPMVLQMPILFAMFRFFPGSIELRQESFLWATDLSTYDSIFEWSAQIPLLSQFYGNHISLFTILMTVSTLLSMKMNTQATANTSMPGMQTMMYIMPIMFMFVLNSFSAGLTYYYFLANMITFGQNLLFKYLIDEDAILKKLQSKKAKPRKKSGFQARMEKMAKERGYQPKK